MLWLRSRIHVELRGRNLAERAVTILLVTSSLIVILTTLGILLCSIQATALMHGLAETNQPIL